MSRRAALHNLGCKVNAYELEAMQQLLEKAGYEIVPFEPGADVYVINTCTVTNIADRKSRQMLHRAKKMNPDAIVVAVGCYVQVRGEQLKADPAIDLVLGTAEKEQLAEKLEACFAARTSVTEQAAESGLSGPEQEEECAAPAQEKAEGCAAPVQEQAEECAATVSDKSGTWTYDSLRLERTDNHTRAFLKVQDGCNQFCSYCIIPYARGRVRSRGISDVVRETERLALAGVKEVVLTGIHLCSYGKDLGDGIDLAALIRAVHAVDGIYRIRLGSLEPGSVTEPFIREMAELPKLCPHFHLSLQSGCDRTLQRMNRHYTADEYAEVCRLLRVYFDDPAITTDIIAGFPGETEEDFEACRAFTEKIAFSETHIFPYSRREGTRAASFDGQLTEQEKHRRCRILLDLNERRKQEYLGRWIGKPVEVLFEEQTELDGRMWWTGHGKEYQRILLASEEELTNCILTVIPDRLAAHKNFELALLSHVG